MGKILKDAVTGNTPFWVLTIAALLIVFISLACPPPGELGEHVVPVIGELIGIMAIWVLVKAIDKGTTTTVRHNNTEVRIDGEHNGEGSR